VTDTRQPSVDSTARLTVEPRRYCVFCEIIAGREPAEVLYRDDDVIVFRNLLRWVPVMLLAVPTRHLRQSELWRDMGKVAAVAVEMGERHCTDGFRLLSNFGFAALQSQEHAHVHIIGGTYLGHYA
jgi:histidine triad (HIT) family protein